MIQPKMKITDNKDNGKDWGYKNIMSMNWDSYGNLWLVTVDFMETGRGNGFATFFNDEGVFINDHKNLKGEIVFNLKGI